MAAAEDKVFGQFRVVFLLQDIKFVFDSACGVNIVYCFCKQILNCPSDVIRVSPGLTSWISFKTISPFSKISKSKVLNSTK